MRAAIPLALVLLAAPSVAAAHTRLVRAVPEARAQLAAAPTRVDLRFSDRVEGRFSTATVEAADGRPVDLGDARVEDGDRRLSVGLARGLPPGTYTVRYRVLSIDGHVVEGAYRFTLTPP